MLNHMPETTTLLQIYSKWIIKEKCKYRNVYLNIICICEWGLDICSFKLKAIALKLEYIYIYIYYIYIYIYIYIEIYIYMRETHSFVTNS